MFFKTLQQIRESKKDKELKIVSLNWYFRDSNCLVFSVQELQKLRRLIDSDPKLFTADVLLRLMLTYRDIQVSTVKGNFHDPLYYSLFVYT